MDHQALIGKLLFLSHHHPFPHTIDLKDVKGVRSRKPQSLSLPDRETVNALMIAEHFSRTVDNLPAIEIVVFSHGLHQGPVVAKADVLALRPVGNG